MTQKLYKGVAALLLTVAGFSYTANAQDVYWRESFTLAATVTSDPGVNSTVYDYTGDAGVWTFYGVYTTTGTDCPAAGQASGTNRHIRSTSAAIGAGTPDITDDDTAYIISPVVSKGVQEIHILRSRISRKFTIWKTTDQSATTTNWILASTIPKSANSPVAVCTDTAIIINDGTVKRIRIRFERAGNSDVDSIYFTSVGPLPITFSSTKAFQKNSTVQVEWTSATEINISKYVIEKSLDGRTFTDAATVSAKGNSTVATNYSWSDAAPFNGNNFYRVKAIDKDGEVKYTSILKVSVGKTNLGLVISPNPVRGHQLNLQLNNLNKGVYTLNIYNATGQKVLTQQVVHQGGSASEVLQLPGSVKSGVYSVQLTSNDVNLSKSIIVE